MHDSRGIEIVNFTISFALSAGTLMASAGTPHRLVPAHFYPWAKYVNVMTTSFHGSTWVTYICTVAATGRADSCLVCLSFKPITVGFSRLSPISGPSVIRLAVISRFVALVDTVWPSDSEDMLKNKWTMPKKFTFEVLKGKNLLVFV